MLKCEHGGYPNPNNCSKCICPNGFSGKFCQHVEYSDCGGIVEVNLKKKNIKQLQQNT